MLVTSRRLMTFCVIGIFWLVGAAPAAGQVMHYVAPTALGNGDGASAANAAGYTNLSFWNQINNKLNSNAVTVRFLDGNYTQRLMLDSIGNADHQLTMIGDTAHGAVFNPGTDIAHGIYLLGVRNIAIRQLHFTGDHITSFGIRISGEGGYIDGTHDILMEDCSFTNLTSTYYGATGATLNSHNVTFRNNYFDNVGVDSHAHMIYNDHHCSDIVVEGNYFRNCTGDYVRFCDQTDFSITRNNTFISTASKYNQAFVCMPVFNDVDPGDQYFDTNHQVVGNSFTYHQAGGLRYAVRFYHGGFDPPDLHYLMTAAEGAILLGGTGEQKRDLLLNNTLIDGTKIFVNDNTYSNISTEVAFSSYAIFGAVSRGWDGEADISAAILHSTPDRVPTWTVNSGGDWHDHTQWSNLNRPDNRHEIAVLGPAISGPRTIIANTTYTIKGLRFNSINKYTLDGTGSFTLEADDGHALLDVQSGSHEVHLPILLNSTTDLSVASGSALLLADTLNLNGRTLNVAGPGSLTCAGMVQTSGGTINLQSNSTVTFSSGYVNITLGSTLSGAGTVNGTVLNSGRIAPGQATGTLWIIGDFGQGANGQLDIETTFAGQHDSLAVLGRAILDGKLKLTRLDGYVPAMGTRITILTSQSLSGKFTTVEGLSINSNLSLAVTYTANSVLVTAARPGDANLDGRVNLADLQILGDHWNGTSASWALGDFSGDGRVNLSDLQIIGDNWGYGTSPDIAFDEAWRQIGDQIPEPGTLVVVLFSLCAMRRRC